MTRPLLHFAGLVGIAVVMSACSSGEKAVACSTNSDCDAGSVCVNDECQTTECLTSADCELGENCSSSFECTTGCAEDTDCVAGEACNDGTCETYGCRDTHLDCSYGEFCDTTTGLCYPDESGVCSPCDPGSDANCFATTERGPCSSSGDCPANQECFIQQLDESSTCASEFDCPSGWECSFVADASGNPVGPYCLTTACYEGSSLSECDPSAAGNECARGFQCQDIGRGQGVCFGDCGWLKENGYL